jgi:hypothetical protein
MLRPATLKNLALLIGSLFFVFIVFEVLVRLFSPQVFEIHPRGMYSVDEDVGYALTPDFEGMLQRHEFSTRVSVNDLGLRGSPVGPRKDGVSRILVLGDSFAFGYGVEEDETFAAYLEACLNRTGQGVFEVLNAGVPGYGTVDQLNFLRSRGEVLAPDFVVLQFLSSNDLDENRYPATEWADVQDGWLGFRSDSYDPATMLPRWKQFEYWIKENLHSAKFVSQRIGYLVLKSSLFPKMELAIWGELFSEEEETLFEAALTDISSYVANLDAGFLFLYVTDQGPVLARRERELRSEALVERVLAAQRIEWINMYRLMRAHEDRASFYFPMDGHWNAAGHEFAAEALCGKIRTAQENMP